jgi:hypothetical protein
MSEKSTRIRYAFSGEHGVHKSTRNFQVGTQSLNVRLNLDVLTYSIVDENTNDLIQTGGENSEPLLKKSAKHALQSLGVSFENELRKKDHASV